MDLNDYHSNLGFSFSGKNVVYRAFPTIPRKQLDKSLALSATYSKFKQYRKNKTSPIYVTRKRQLFQADLAFFTGEHLIQHNGGMQYLLVIIDAFSKMVWLYPLENKQCSTVMNKFEHLFNTPSQIPSHLQTDRGTEFLCSSIGKFFRNKNINHYTTHSDRKAAIAERVIRTLKNILYKMMDYNNTFNWVDLLEDAREKYLNSYHRTIRMTPLQAEMSQNQSKLRKYYHIRGVKYKRNNTKPKYKIGDMVRIRRLYDKWKRGHEPDFTEEYFIIHSVDILPKPSPVYRLKTTNGELLKEDPTFFEEELSLFIPTENTQFKIQDILRKRKVGNKTQYLVTWVGWPESAATWTDEDQIVDI